MGICLSSSSSWKQESDENIVYVVGKEASECNNGGGIRRLTSLYSRQGSKGPNQDSAILCQGYGAEDGVFCGVFDGHGKNGHIVSKIVRDYLPSLLLSHRNIITAAAEDHHGHGLENCSKDGENCQTISPELFEWEDHYGLEKCPKKDENCQTISPKLFEWKDHHGLEKCPKKDEKCRTISPELFKEWKDHHSLEKCSKKDENCQTISPELFEEWKDQHGLEKCPKKDENCRTISSELFEEWKEASISGFKAMDRELKLLTNMDCSYSGTTAVTIIKQGEDVIIANLGDSRAVLGRVSEKGRLKAVQLTIDLKPSVPKEAERIRSSNGRVFAMEDEPSIQRIWMPNNKSPGLSMARAFGDFQLKNYGLIAIPEIFHHRLTPNDLFIVLATDGVWDVLSNEQVVSVVASAEKKGSGEAAKLVVEAAAKAWRRKFPSSKVDDCSALCFFLQEKS